MGVFKVVFGQEVPYLDPNFRSIFLNVAGEATVSCADREGSESDVEYVKALIISAVQDQIAKYGNEYTSYKDLPGKSVVMGQSVAAELGAKNITLNDFSITNIVPDDRSMQRISDMSKVQSAAVSPQEQMKMMEEANKRAQQELSQLSAEQRRQAEEQAKQILQQQAADMQKIMEQINQMKGAAAGSTAAATAAIASAEPPKKKFCSQCGAPRGNGKFCARCGNPL